MALSTWFAPDDNGLSKKRDSPRLQATNASSMRLPWNSIRRRRIVLAIVVVIAIYIFVRNIPNDVVPVGQRYNPLYGSMASGHTQHQLGVILGQGQNQNKKGSGKVHEEPVLFPQLASTLHTFASNSFKDNVLFILLYPSSAAHMLPLACHMIRKEQNHIHVALMGRSTAKSEEIMKLNGLILEDCPLVWHDARPDFAMESSERRIIASIQQGYYYLHRGLAPSTVFVDDMRLSGEPQSIALEYSIGRLNTPLLRIPPATTRFMPWLALLDGSALAHFNEIEIEIVIQAYSESAGSLIRLLRSLKNANYSGLQFPRLTIELPSHADPNLISFLSRFRWPPSSTAGPNLLTIRRRIDPGHITPAEASLRTLELFYPAANSEKNHVLLLNPDIELSKGFMHYLMFSVLHFRHGRMSSAHGARLFGISLDLPATKLDGSDSFMRLSKSVSSPFMLSQTPNSRAGLYFGDQWMEFHTFLSKRLANDPQLQKGRVKVSTDHPQWTKHALELMQVRGLYMLYPAFAKNVEEQVAFLHRDLQHKPEEFADLEDDSTVPTDSSDPSWLAGSDMLGEEPGSNQALAEQLASSAHDFLPTVLVGNSTGPNEDVISPLSYLTPYSVTGEATEWFETDEIASKEADQFSLRVGGCTSLEARDTKKAGTIEYLFCEPG